MDKLKEENKRLREALEEIAEMTSKEGVRRIQKNKCEHGREHEAYPRIVGSTYSTAMYGLYGVEWLLRRDESE